MRLNLLLCEYITDKLLKSLYSFGFFSAGVLLGILLVLLIYKIFTKTQAKPLKLKKNFEETDLINHDIEQNAVAIIKGLDTRQPIDVYAIQALNALIQALKDTAKVYTDNKHTVEITLEGLQEKYPFLTLSFDTDITVENALKFIAEGGDIIEETLLDTIDSYSALASAFLRFLGFKGNIRDITIKEVILYLNKKAEKKNKKIEKQEAKAQKDNEKLEAKKLKLLEKERLEKEKLKERRKKEKENHKKKSTSRKKSSDKREHGEGTNKFLSLFKRKPKEKDANKEGNPEKQEKMELTAFVKPVNKVLREIFIKLVFSLCGEAKRLYGDGFIINKTEEEQKLLEEKEIEKTLREIESTDDGEVIE